MDSLLRKRARLFGRDARKLRNEGVYAANPPTEFGGGFASPTLIIANLEDECVPSRSSRRPTRRETSKFETEVAALLSPSAYADDAVLDAVFARLRRLSPVHWVDVPGVEPFWAVTRHADVLSVELRSQQFGTEPRTYL